MLKQLNTIRYTYIRSHFYGLFLTTLTITAVFLSIYVIFQPGWLSRTAIFSFVCLYILLGLIISVYVGFKSSGDIKDRMDYLSVLIAQLSRGNYTTKVYYSEGDEIARIGNELNELGEKLQSQVKSLQRLADEKAEFAKSAHKAAAMEERQRLARDLHDAVSQQLFGLTMISQASLKVFDQNPVQAREYLIDIADTALKAQVEMRALLLHLRPVHLSGEKLETGIEQLINELRQKCQMDFQISIKEIGNVSEVIEEHLFRTVQEALSNTLRHAEASQVALELSKKSNDVFLRISDNGKGFDLEEDQHKKTSYGLKTMKERCEEIGGTFAVRTKRGEGTYIDIRIPV